jgi:hypothetical protein
VRKRYLGLLGLALAMNACQPACTPSSPPAATARSTNPPPPTTQPPWYTTLIEAECDEYGLVGLWIDNTGNRTIRVSNDESGLADLAPGESLFVAWPDTVGWPYTDDAPTVPSQQMSLRYVDAVSGFVIGTVAYAYAGWCPT